MKTFPLVMIIGLALTGCIGPTVTQSDITAAHYAALPADYQQKIRDAMSSTLKDPYSAVYKFHEPRRGWWQDGPLAGGAKHFGYVVTVGINAKNSFGGYIGEQSYYFAFQNGTVVSVAELFNLKMGGFID